MDETPRRTNIKTKGGIPMIEIFVCDDDKNDLQTTAKLLEEIISEQKISYRLHAFLSPEEMMKNMEAIDIGILDIAMKECNGIELGRRIREKIPEVKLIYTTGFEEYCMQAVNDVHAFSFLCKPIMRDELMAQLLAALAVLPDSGPEKAFYDLTDSCGKKYPAIKLRLKDILYFEYIKRQRKAVIVLKNETYICGCVFEKLARELAPSISRSTAVECWSISDMWKRYAETQSVWITERSFPLRRNENALSGEA